MNILHGCLVRSILILAALTIHSSRVFAIDACIDYENRASWRGHIPAQTTVSSLQLLGDYAFTSEGVFDVSNPSTPTRVEVDWPVEPLVRDVHGSLAFVTLPDSSLVAVDARDPLDAILLARTRLPASASLLAAGDGFACVTLGNRPGAHIYSFHPREARFVSSRLVPWTVRALAAEGHFVYVLNDLGILHIFDVTNFQAPREVSRLDGFWGSAIDVGAGLLVFSTSNGIALVDVRDPARPAFLGYVDPSSDAPVWINDGRVAWLGYSRLLVADIGDPRAPRRIGDFYVGQYSQVAVRGDRVVASHSFYGDYRHIPPPPGIHVFDLTAAGAIEPLAIIPLDSTYRGGIGVANDLAYIATPAGLQILDLSNVAVPVSRGRVAASWWPHDVVIAGARAFIAAEDYPPTTGSGFYILDVSNADAPQRLGSVDGSVRKMAIRGDHAYATGWVDFRVIDLSNLASPRVVGELPLMYGTSVALHGERAFVGTTSGLRVIDIAHPDAPFVVREDQGEVNDVAVDARFLYVARGPRLEIRSLDDVDGAVVGSYSVPFNIGRIAVAPTAVYISVTGEGTEYPTSTIHALDLSNPQIPRLIGVLDPTETPADLDLLGERILIEAHDALVIYPEPCTAATPVLLSDLVAREDGDAIHLQWRASDVDEIVEFSVRRSDEQDEREVARLPVREPMEYRDLNVEPGVSYTYRVVAELANGSQVTSAPVTASRGRSHFTLSPAWPNPAPGRTSLQFTLPAAGDVRLEIFDVAGRRVRGVFEGRATAGSTIVRWDGRTESGRPAARGAYVARLIAAHGTRTTRFVLGAEPTNRSR